MVFSVELSDILHPRRFQNESRRLGWVPLGIDAGEVFWRKQDTLIKKKTKFSSYIRKSRRERLQSLICLTASSYMTKYFCFFSYIRKPFLICIWLCNSSRLNFFVHEENFLFFFIFHSFAGFWYPATKIGISLVYIIGTNIEKKEKRCRTSIYRTESRQFHWRACSFVI